MSTSTIPSETHQLQPQTPPPDPPLPFSFDLFDRIAHGNSFPEMLLKDLQCTHSQLTQFLASQECQHHLALRHHLSAFQTTIKSLDASAAALASLQQLADHSKNPIAQRLAASQLLDLAGLHSPPKPPTLILHESLNGRFTNHKSPPPPRGGDKPPSLTEPPAPPVRPHATEGTAFSLSPNKIPPLTLPPPPAPRFSRFFPALNALLLALLLLQNTAPTFHSLLHLATPTVTSAQKVFSEASAPAAIPKMLAPFQAGKMIVLLDEVRKNEGGLVYAADEPAGNSGAWADCHGLKMSGSTRYTSATHRAPHGWPYFAMPQIRAGRGFGPWMRWTICDASGCGSHFDGEFYLIDSIVPVEALTRWRSRPLLGIFPGEGVGPEVIGAATRVLDAVESACGIKIERMMAETISPGCCESAIYDAAAGFCHTVFERRGAVLCGPLGGRSVYALRRAFDLYCKLAPIKPMRALSEATRFKGEHVRDVGMVVVRDNAGGVYQGSWDDQAGPGRERVAEHRFSYSQRQVERIIAVGVRLARAGRGKMHVIIKDGGVPGISGLWRDVAQAAAAAGSVACVVMNADFAAYQLIQSPREFEVVVTPNLVGDVLADLAAVFLGSRGMSYSANFSADGRAVYQTGHGAAKDLAGTDRANPLAQILSLAMLLRESFGMGEAAARIERAIEHVLGVGWRTDDLGTVEGRRVGTRQMGELVAQAVAGGQG